MRAISTQWQWHIWRWYDNVMYVTKHLSYEISVTNASINSEMTPSLHLPHPVFCPLPDPSALARAQIPPCPSPFNACHAGYSRPGPASYTLQPFIASESLLARLAYKSSSNFASGRVFVFFAAKASDRARAGPNYRNRK